MSKKYEIKTIHHVRRMGMSRNGNPYYTITWDDLSFSRTQIDGSINYGLENRENLNTPVAVFTTKAGRVWDIVPLDKLKEDDSEYRWIMHLHQPMPGAFDIERVTSIEAAKAALVKYGKDTGFYQDLQTNGQYGCSGALYPYSTEDWADAVEYREIGNPFDYPSKLVENGPRGGVKVTNA